MNQRGPSVPWSLSEARTGFLALILGGGLVMWSWWQVSGMGRLSRQTSWLVVAVLGVMVIGMGSLLWITGGRRAVRARRDRLAEQLEEWLTRSASAAALAPAPTGRAGLVALRGSDLYHQHDCLLVRGKQVTALGSPGRRRPCEMCEP